MTAWPHRDDLPVVLVVLDGLGDRPCASLGGRTPAEVARTPVLDELTARGASGVHVPFGPGWATSSERAHWAMFGLSDIEFPGRALLELLGVGGEPPFDAPMWHLAVRHGEVSGEQMRITGRLGSGDASTEREIESVLQRWSAQGGEADVRFTLAPLRFGEWILIGQGLSSREVTDTDPLFDNIHPWMLPLPWAESVRAGGERLFEAQRTASALQSYLQGAYQSLKDAGLGGFVPTTKWPSVWSQPLSFRELVGVKGAMIASSALYRGMARLLGMREIDVRAESGDAAAGLGARVAAAVDILEGPEPPEFMHVHTKAPDEAGHTKNPEAKVAAIEACDMALAPLLDLMDKQEIVLAVTGDHATPSEGRLLHSGDPTPLVVVAPEQRVDDVREFGETPALSGALGTMRAADIAPLLHGLARRPFFIGHRPGAVGSASLPLAPAAMPLPDSEHVHDSFMHVNIPPTMMESPR
jgi:2,3-bisphosphoglycerate-independent phosphoglycerate mutase